MVSEEQLKKVKEQGEALVQIMDEHRKKRPDATGFDQFDPRRTDVIVTTYSKAGTTLLQNLTYHLAYLTVIAPDSPIPPVERFSDISAATPWLDFFPAMDVPLPTTDPRIFKTHAPWQRLERFHADPATAPRQIVIIRSPFALAPSFMDFLFDDLTGHLPESRDPAVREAAFHSFVSRRLAGPDDKKVMGSWFRHAHDYTTPLRENILVLFYEDVIRDLDGTTRTVASFMGIDAALVTDEVVGKVAKACDRRTMAADSRFQCHVEARTFGHGMTRKVQEENRDNSFKQFAYSDEEKEVVKKNMEDVLGHSTYEEFKEATKKAQKVKFGR